VPQKPASANPTPNPSRPLRSVARRTKSASPATQYSAATRHTPISRDPAGCGVDRGLFGDRRNSHALSGLASGVVGRRSRSNSREPVNRFAHAVAQEQAAEQARSSSRRAKGGTRSGAFRVIDAQELAHALSRCDLAAADIRESVLSTTGRIDFLVIDRAVSGRGCRVLDPLRKAVVSLHAHLQSFLKVAMASQPDAQIHSASAIEFNSDNAVTIKSALVSLRALVNKLPCNPEPADALELSSVLDQGLLEQLLSWCSETLSCYSAIYQAFRLAQPPVPRAGAAGFSKPPLVSGNSNSFRRRQAALIAEKLVQAHDGLSGESGEQAPGKENMPVSSTEMGGETRGHASRASRREQQQQPASRECTRDKKEDMERVERRKERGGQRSNDRMQRFRPRAIIIPETSWERSKRR